jgi:pimeloyl-ACP methyl ester carboxylesterase
MPKATDPTIVLVHGALTGASVWNGVSGKLQAEGFITVAPAMPLRGLHTDAEYLASFLDTIGGPVVIAGHSYGGSVISHPVIAKGSVKALIFVAAFAPDTGESVGELNGRWPGSKLGDGTAMIRPYRGGQDLYLRPECFRDVYAGDLSPTTIALMAAAQRPIDTAALSESFRERPTWSNLPSWAVISTRDNSLPVEAQRFMAHRAKSKVTEVDASHASPLSQPEIIAEVIAAAARSVVSIN